MKNKVIFIIIAAAILTAAFFLQGRRNSQGEEFTTEFTTEFSTEVTTETTTEVTSVITETTTATPTTLLQQESTTFAETVTEITTALPLVTAEKPVETTETIPSKTVSLTVEYGVLKGKLEKADKNNGIVYKGEYTLQGEETAFDVLKNSMRQAGIPMEFTKTPAYDSYYIEGIDNVYEFDFGELSGWLYKVNGEFLGYSSSECKVKAGDDIVFIYTCNMGKDVGNDFSG